MIALLTIALCWTFRTGEWLAQQKTMPLKKHGRKAKSIFRSGFDHLRQILLNLELFVDEFFHVLQFCPVLRFTSPDLYLLPIKGWADVYTAEVAFLEPHLYDRRNNDVALHA